VISPRAGRSSKEVESSESLPRRNSSCSFVTSRAMQALRLPRNLPGVGNTLGDPVRSFVKDDGAVLDAQAFECTAAFAAPRRQEAHEQKFFVGQARKRKGSGAARNGPGIGTTGI